MLKKQTNNQKQQQHQNLKAIQIAIVVSLYNRELTETLEKKCIQKLISKNLDKNQLNIFYVPGAFEIPLKCQQLAKTNKYNAIIALGMVLKGDTYHFELVANECARGVMQVMLKYNIPIIFEVLACYNNDDAQRRCGDDDYNRGIEAANTVLQILDV
jgi:6,7-dimethyl-8-ribityllumazine synthase